MADIPARRSAKLTSPPPYVGDISSTTVVVAYVDGGPRIFNADGTLGSTLSDGTILAASGQDLVVVLPGRAYVPALEAAAAGSGHVTSTGHTAGAGVYVNPQSTPLRRKHGAQIKSNGRHVVCIGGQVDMDRDWTDNGDGTHTGVLEQQNRALYVTGTNTGVTHLEGCAFTGDWQYEVFNYGGGTGSGTALVWQNMAVRAGSDGISVRYIPINATGAGNHSGGDVIQTFTMPRGIILDGHLDSGATFQSIFLKAETGQTRPDFLYAKNYLSANYHGPGAWLYLMPDPAGNVCPHVRLSGLWMQPASMYGPNADYTASVPRVPTVMTTLTNNVYPNGSAQIVGTSVDGLPTLTEDGWLTTDGTVNPGLTRTLSTTVTAVDSMVLSATPGMGYVSPGYRSSVPITSTALLAAVETPSLAAPTTPGTYEYRDGVWTLLTAYEVVDGALAGQLTIDTTKRGTDLTAPYTLALVSKTSTTVNVQWQEDPDATVVGHRLYVNGARYGSDLPANALTATIGNLTGGTTYTFAVSRVNGLGQESAQSNVLQVTTTSVTPGVPTAPTALTQTALTDTSVTYSITESADASVLRHWRYLDGVRFGAALGANATSAQWTGLAAGTSHSVYVTRENATGESAASPVKTFKTTGGIPVAHDVVMGVPDNDEVTKLTISAWPAARVYDLNSVSGTVSRWGCRVIGLTDSTAGSNTGGQTTADRLLNFLEGFYYNSTGGVQTAHANVEIHFAVGNEIDKDTGYTSGTLPTAYVDTVRLCAAAVRTKNADGTRRYPLASMWVDLTQHQIKINSSGTRFKAIAQYLDGMACSMYPPGRDLSKNRPDSPVFTPYPDYIDPVMAVMQDWNTTYPSCNQFATWEVGIPVDHAYWQAGGTKDSNGEPTSSTDITVRPRYFAGGVDKGGTNWTGFLQYIYNKLDGMGVRMREQVYWNQCSNPDIPNQLWHDKAPKTTPDTETAWHNWTPGSRLPNG